MVTWLRYWKLNSQLVTNVCSFVHAKHSWTSFASDRGEHDFTKLTEYQNLRGRMNMLEMVEYEFEGFVAGWSNRRKWQKTKKKC